MYKCKILTSKRLSAFFYKSCTNLNNIQFLLKLYRFFLNLIFLNLKRSFLDIKKGFNNITKIVI